MKAVVFHGIGDIRIDTVPDPGLAQTTDAVVRLTSSAICGTDLHMVRGTLGGMKPGTILGHEGVGLVEEVGRDVRNLRRGDRVLIPSTISCGHCAYCRAGYTAQCDTANPGGPLAGTAFFGGPQASGAFDGLQAEYARTPFAHASLIRLPDSLDDERAILMSDIFPTGYFGAQLAEVRMGDTVAVFGAGPVGQFAIASAKLMGAGRVIAIDRVVSRLEMACAQGAEVINFDDDDPVDTILQLTGGIGVDRVIDAVGVDAVRPTRGPAAPHDAQSRRAFDDEVRELAPRTRADGGHWVPGDAPSQVLQWAVRAVAKAGTVSIIGVYPMNDRFFPIGAAMNRNLTVKMGNCNHRAITPKLIEIVRSGAFDPITVLTQAEPLTSAIDAYRAFDTREPGWIKAKLEP
ncbi:S-(hydroxymethyl)glutathione dehydrogenase [Burkholderia pseudomallei]|uniref:zinc-dependent alcohol dehydrogenase n=1 Tax=Burkholderia pseudomallei TaxID=28450 RepID=UPI000F048A67|nr:zinc-dependent alcohol dehydrogenase [Burkholderia pseudomallei]CAJ5501449.1 S-(hydroxymethyl)glutathione dehydrogenase [Burkholderia pseudomallei]CAJ6894309.1 S-(hydroxymethyl)glutathione dehydrogenase [Burkholderia pseudomallei]CAJ6982629.1 S-(hydroxymethyl)glutathione dehydrogenase [Burkholderia pseudomallei]CAJ8534320.1 S-(hydroxymethyl)glutathione dehydrogenase [Burkholderia pseudomallei]CAJ9008790.1 S-(hydroxymethyl)glutathione dehydrogenase [Burkholderia pseudomallei]